MDSATVPTTPDSDATFSVASSASSLSSYPDSQLALNKEQEDAGEDGPAVFSSTPPPLPSRASSPATRTDYRPQPPPKRTGPPPPLPKVTWSEWAVKKVRHAPTGAIKGWRARRLG